MADRLSETRNRDNPFNFSRIYQERMVARYRLTTILSLAMATLVIPARAENRVNVEYGHAGGVSLRLDMHLPEGPGPFPAAIVVHGGAWVTGDRKANVEPLFEPLSNAQFAWFSISYRLVNDIPSSISSDKTIASLLSMGTAVDDVRQAVQYVKAHALEFRVDPDRIALIGESAGAQLAAMAALKPGPNGDVRALVAFYCPSDLVSLAKTLKQIPDSVRQSIKGTLWETMLNGALRQVSPMTWVSKDAPPVLLIHGTADTVVPFEQSTAFCAAINAAGGSCTLYPVPGGGHGMRSWDTKSTTGYRPAMIDWLRKSMTPLSPTHV